MTSFFKRVLDAYRILTGKDDAVQKGIMQLQKEIAQREARRAVQQAALEKQILEELRQSSEALKTIKDGYIAQEEEIARFAAALGESAQAQMAAQAEAEAQMFLETARRSGIQLEAPPPFSEFVKRANLGLASGEAVTTMLGDMRRSQGSEGTYGEAGRAGVEQAGIVDAVLGAEDDKVEQGAEQSAGHDARQSGIQDRAGDPEKEVTELGGIQNGAREGEHAATVEVEVNELPAERAQRNGTRGRERQAGSKGSTPWEEAVESDEANVEKSREEIASFIELPSQPSSNPEAVAGSLGVVLAPAHGPAPNIAHEDEQALPPLESEVTRSVSDIEVESRSGKPKSGEITRKRNGKKSDEVEAKIEKGSQAPKTRKKRAPGKKKAEL
ncbi:hypothetical protein KFL_001330020 [Klebsormidium nitens]|uniref:Uncharacterized protein n=1 Tax=Klebsormidium nitens TaxID=105231 RepID=A0A0U9HRK3_KLENI|nr:hypothetical protein KFL_001330020 [Klebsormidium nitens]|eukprot:GAQ83020.1 hypothetical protein KFL_001330020 [Klebsormidium nitens]